MEERHAVAITTDIHKSTRLPKSHKPAVPTSKAFVSHYKFPSIHAHSIALNCSQVYNLHE